jgi:hypothetical protein
VVLFCFGLAACAVFQMPRPWAELARLERTGAPIYKQQDAIELVAATTRPGDKVAIITPLGHRVAYDAGVVDVAPYASAESMPTAEQLGTTLDVMGRNGVTQIYVYRQGTAPALFQALVAAGYGIRSERGEYLMLTNAAQGP